MGSNQLVKKLANAAKIGNECNKVECRIIQWFFFRLNFIHAHFLAIKLALIVD